MMKIQVFQKIIPQTNKRKLILLTLLGVSAFILTRCTVLSFYPLYTQDELIKDDRIVGTWMSKLITEEVSNDSIVWEISPKKKSIPLISTKSEKSTSNKFTYTLKLYSSKDPKDMAVFDIHIVQLENNLYLDFWLDELEMGSVNGIALMHLIGVHTFAKLEIGDDITVKWFDGELLNELMKENKIRIKHEKRGDEFLLTAKPKELQKFIVKFADREEAFYKDLSYSLSPYEKPVKQNLTK